MYYPDTNCLFFGCSFFGSCDFSWKIRAKCQVWQQRQDRFTEWFIF